MDHRGLVCGEDVVVGRKVVGVRGYVEEHIARELHCMAVAAGRLDMCQVQEDYIPLDGGGRPWNARD